MSILDFLKKHLVLSAVFAARFLIADQALGIIGGENDDSSSQGYAALFYPDGSPQLVPVSVYPTAIGIYDVAMNASGQSIVCGQNTPTMLVKMYAALISADGATVTPTTANATNGFLLAADINGSGNGIVGGIFNGQYTYAALVNPTGVVTVINTPNTQILGTVPAVAINNSGEGLIGGRYFDTMQSKYVPYAALVSPQGVASSLNFSNSAGNSDLIRTVGINNHNQRVIGGEVGSAPYVAFVDPDGTMHPINTGLETINGYVSDLALNELGLVILVGGSGNGPYPGYVSYIYPDRRVQQIDVGLADGYIETVAINENGLAIMGGYDSSGAQPPFAAFVSPLGNVISIDTGISSGEIYTVDINPYGQALLGGQDYTDNSPYFAIVTPQGIATRISLGFSSGYIGGVAMNNFQTGSLPTGSLSGNNLIFANYISQNAQQDAIYFLPSILTGTLAEALESAAPTRNAFSVYSASNNLFYLTTSLSNHLRHKKLGMRNYESPTSVASSAAHMKPWQSEVGLLASLELPEENEACDPCVSEEMSSYSIWFDALGQLAYQKAQSETPAFSPATGGGVLAFDGRVNDNTRLGIGLAYLFTHIHEKNGAGHSNINQEDLFAYGSWENDSFYFDLSLLGGLFQIDQVRNIHITGFDFKASSKPDGWQLLPHLELGYKFTKLNANQDFEWTLNPFIMLDWANAWQGSYREKGDSPFNAEQKAQYGSLLRTELSLRLNEAIFFDSWSLIFQEKGGYVNTQSFGAGKVNAFLVGSPGTFTVETLASAQNLGVGEFAMIFAPSSSWLPTSTLLYQGQFGSQYQSHQLNLEFAWNF